MMLLKKLICKSVIKKRCFIILKLLQRARTFSIIKSINVYGGDCGHTQQFRNCRRDGDSRYSNRVNRAAIISGLINI